MGNLRQVRQMAVTKIIKIKASVGGCIDYAENDKKTKNKEYVSYYGCGSNNAEYSFITALGNNDNREKTSIQDEVKAYHIIQSFAKTDDISPEKANEIGRKLMDELFEGRHAFVCATHTDKGHIHNHIVVCAAEMAMTGKKINDNLTLLHKIRKTSDKLCMEYGLDVIDKPQGRGKSYKEWLADNQNPKGSKKQQLRDLIDSTIKVSMDFNDFISRMREAGAQVETKTSPKYGQITKYKLPDASEKDHFNRGYRLGPGYSDDIIAKRIENRITREAEREARKQKRASMSKGERLRDSTKLKIHSMIDTSGDKVSNENRKLKEWKDRQNVMLAEKIKATVQEKYGIDYARISTKIHSLTAENNADNAAIAKNKEAMKELRIAISNCQTYIDTYKTNERYEKSKDQERYYENHDAALNAFAAADDYLTRKGINKALLQDKETAGMYLASLQNRLQSVEDTNAALADKIKEREKTIAELSKFQKDLDTFHHRKTPGIE